MMKIAARRGLMMVPVFIAALVVAVWVFSYHSFEFKGGVGVRDSGVFSYPRYHAQLDDLPLWKSGEYQFIVRGLPPGPLDLVLQVPDATDADRAELTSLSTSVSVSTTDSFGKEVCTATGNLSGARNRDRSAWVLASTSSSASFWQPRCQQLPFSRFKTYTVKVTVSGADDHSPHRMLRPILQGGGNELP
jgi:hypothetical protein